MERRFVSIFDRLSERKTRGETFHGILKGSPNDELVAALAVAGKEDAVAANAIATELLNRLRRAPFLGAALVSLSIIVAIYILDFAYTGTFLLLDSNDHAPVLAALTAGLGVLTVLFLAMGLGAFRTLRMRLLGPPTRGI